MMSSLVRSAASKPHFSKYMSLCLLFFSAPSSISISIVSDRQLWRWVSKELLLGGVL
jgi:hypothetical protein